MENSVTMSGAIVRWGPITIKKTPICFSSMGLKYFLAAAKNFLAQCQGKIDL